MIGALQWELSLSTVWQDRSGTGATMAFFGKTVQEQAPLWPFLAKPRRNMRHYGLFWQNRTGPGATMGFIWQKRSQTGATMAFFGKTAQEHVPLWLYLANTYRTRRHY